MRKYWKPAEKKNDLPHIVKVCTVKRGIKELSIHISMPTVDAAGNVLLPY